MGYFQPMVIYRDPDEKRENSILRYIGNRVLTKNANFLCAVIGQTGSGKSYSCLKMAEDYAQMYGIEFNPEYHVITSLEELLILITEPEETRKIRFGSVLVFDEPQIEANARNWQSEMNQALNQLISTFRNQRLVIFFALPYLEMFDKQSRILFHGEFKVEGYDINTKITTVKPRFLEYNKNQDSFYHKRLIVQHKERDKEVMVIDKLNYWYLGLASKPIIEVYEGKKKRFTDDLNKRLLAQIQNQRKKTDGSDKSADLFQVQALYDKYGEDYPKILTEMPQLTPYTLERFLFYIKKSRKMIYSRTK